MQQARSEVETRRKKIVMVHPEFPPSFWSFGFVKDIGGFKTVMPPLGLATVAALTPDRYDVTIVDENIEPIDFDVEADLIVLSAMGIQEKRLFEVADRFRANGYTVCMGGPICNVVPERCRPHCDVLFEGEGEYTWKIFLDAWELGEHEDRYVQDEKIDMRDTPRPRLDLLDASAYRVGAVQTTRGCPFNCEFCDIIVTYGRKVRMKPIENVLQELQSWADAGVDFITLVDDNLVGNRKYAKEMLKAVGDWNRARRTQVSLYVEMSVDCVRDPELMELMRQANVTEAFIGIESPRKESLIETGKLQNVAANLVEDIKTIQSYGMVTVAGMIVGFDNDDADIFEDQYEFLQLAGVPIVMLGILQAIPRTPLYERLEKVGRLRSAAQGNNTLSFTNIEPAQMSYDELIHGYRELFQRIYTWEALGDRWLSNVEQWTKYPDRPFIQKPLGRWRPFLIRQTMMIARYYLTGGSEHRRFARRMLWGTLRRAPRTLHQTVSYLAYFIHLREYADRVIAKEYKFDYALNEVNFAESNRFGEGGAINMVRQEKERRQTIEIYDAYEPAEAARSAEGG
ncbi:MAG: B12-binding domain-containing radical SAM protein [Chloroflexi bacterium]|nr:B12-binding domain-containing radical SAM protein [Chloroflexota bacterium]